MYMYVCTCMYMYVCMYMYMYCLLYSLSHANSWKLIRPHFQVSKRDACDVTVIISLSLSLSQEIFVDIVFPLLCYNDDDNQLWHDDPYEYIRMKFGMYYVLCTYDHVDPVAHFNFV